MLLVDFLPTTQKLVDEWDTLGAKRIELNVYQRQGKVYSGKEPYFNMIFIIQKSILLVFSNIAGIFSGL